MSNVRCKDYRVCFVISSKITLIWSAFLKKVQKNLHLPVCIPKIYATYGWLWLINHVSQWQTLARYNVVLKVTCIDTNAAISFDCDNFLIESTVYL